MTTPYRTRSGLAIGSAVQPKPKRVDMNSDELAIQRALLPAPVQPIALHEWVLFVITGFVVVAILAGWI